MRWLLFLSRLSFICGVCFLIAFAFDMGNIENQEPYSRTVFFIGYMMGLAIVPCTIIAYMALTLLGKKIRPIVPLWLIIANISFLLILLFYIFYLNSLSNPHG
jgi:hypothetical protein